MRRRMPPPNPLLDELQDERDDLKIRVSLMADSASRDQAELKLLLEQLAEIEQRLSAERRSA